jgi:hypothetical protein
MRVVMPPVVDGALNEDVWRDAPSSGQFWIPQWNQPPSDDTTVKVVQDGHTLYVAFSCHDSQPGLIKATQIRRDGSPAFDDRVTVELDPYHNHRSISRFTVTARGTQSDAIAGGRAKKIEWKGDWHAAAQRTSTGWTAEMAIPLDILDFNAGVETFGINFLRYQSRTQEWSGWANVTARNLPEEAGHLTGLQLTTATTPSKLTVMQYASGAMNAAGPDGDIRRRTGGTGLDMRYERGTITSMVSAAPDFSETETDVVDLGFSYNEKYVSDRRPFFQEGGAFFGDRSLFYSGRIESFDLGAKSFGRVDKYQVGVLAIADTSGGRSDYVGRVVRELGSTFSSSVMFVGTERASFSNNTVQVQAGGRVGKRLKVDTQMASSSTSVGEGDGQRLRGAVEYQTSHWYNGAWADQIDATFLAANGFSAADVLGTNGRGMYSTYNRGFGRGWLRRADMSLSYERRDTEVGDLQRESVSFYAGGETASNIQVNAGLTTGPYRPRGEAVGQWADALNEDRYYQASVYHSHPTGLFSYGANYSWGFLSNGTYRNLAPSLQVSPNSHLSLGYSFERADYYDVQNQHVLSGTVQVTPTQAISARWVQYDEPFFRVSYRRAVKRGVDVFGVYSSDPYRADSVNLKLVWTLLPFSAR